MSFRPVTTKVIKAGRSKALFLLFFGNRKRDDNEPVKRMPRVFIAVLLLLVVTILGICIYAFLNGKLG